MALVVDPEDLNNIRGRIVEMDFSFQDTILRPQSTGFVATLRLKA